MMMTQGPIEFFVPGLPTPGGSKRAFVLQRNGQIIRKNGRPIVNVIDSGGERTKNWRQSVATFAREAYWGEPLRGPIRLTIRFVMRRPKSHFRTGKFCDELRPNAPEYHCTKPDRTKLLRSTEDALTGILWMDDTQIVDGDVQKVYGQRPGAHIRVELLT